jgi:hypothetical protein
MRRAWLLIENLVVAYPQTTLTGDVSAGGDGGIQVAWKKDEARITVAVPGHKGGEEYVYRRNPDKTSFVQNNIDEQMIARELSSL